MDPKIFKTVLQDEPTEEQYVFWRKMLDVYMNKAEVPDESKLETLYVLCGPRGFATIADCETYNDAIDLLDPKYIKRASAITMRHKLRSHKQKDGKSIEEYVSELRQLSRKCPTKALTAD